ncbi:MAG: sensor histidine kinase [Anaerolineae bacterium]|nr:sensor histidine kinase [Anaerolineae bacterium]
MAANTISPATDPPSMAAPGSRWLQRVRAGWLALVALMFVTFLISIPGTYEMLQTPCTSDADCMSWAQPTPDIIVRIEQSGISLRASALYLTSLYTAVSLVFWVVGLLIYHYRPDQWFALLVAHLMILLGTGGVSLVFSSGLAFTSVPPVIGILVGILTISMYQFISIVLLTFPNGRFYGRWNFIPFILICLNTLVWLAPIPVESVNLEAFNIWLMIVFGSQLVAQVIRYWRMYTPAERQQTNWLIFGVGLTVLMFLSKSVLVAFGIIPPDGVHPLVENTLVIFVYLPIGVAIGIAILRYRLWDIDVIISRTLVYTLLTALVVAIYVSIVGALSALFESSGSNLALSLSATGVVAVAFQPMRGYLQRAVDRVMFGERDNPYQVISRLNAGIEANVSLARLLPAVAETVAQTLKIPYVSIAVQDGDTLRTEATFGQPSDRGRIITLPLVYGPETVGQMIIGQAAGDKALQSAEHQLLENIARQTAIAIHAVQLTEALQQSRLDIVTVREEERRRLRRDLHDGLGPTLASHTLKIGAARALIESSPDRASMILADLEDSLAVSLADIRRLVYNLRPPTLDQLGLAGALRDFVEQYPVTDSVEEIPAFTVIIPETLPPLPAAAEVAAYRIVQEALHNVVRHAGARRAVIDIQVNGALEITVTDDGRGLPGYVRRGVGLNSMRERAEELGGECTVQNRPEGGTCLHARIPLP